MAMAGFGKSLKPLFREFGDLAIYVKMGRSSFGRPLANAIVASGVNRVAKADALIARVKYAPVSLRGGAGYNYESDIIDFPRKLRSRVLSGDAKVSSIMMHELGHRVDRKSVVRVGASYARASEAHNVKGQSSAMISAAARTVASEENAWNFSDAVLGITKEGLKARKMGLTTYGNFTNINSQRLRRQLVGSSDSSRRDVVSQYAQNHNRAVVPKTLKIIEPRKGMEGGDTLSELVYRSVESAPYSENAVIRLTDRFTKNTLSSAGRSSVIRKSWRRRRILHGPSGRSKTGIK